MRLRIAAVAGASLAALLAIASNGFTAQPSRGDTALLQLIRQSLPHVDAASRQGDEGRGSPDAVQAQYDAARDAQDALRTVPRISRGCDQLAAAFQLYLRSQVMEAEGVDRPSHAELAQGVRIADATRPRLSALLHPCSAGSTAPISPPGPAELSDPQSDETFTGVLRAAVPRGATRGQLVIDGKPSQMRPMHFPAVSITVPAAPGRHTIGLRLYAATKLVQNLESRDVWLLPPSSQRLTVLEQRSRELDAKLAVLANGFTGQAAIWVENLADGSYGAWNEDARFPAASTVKLAVLIAALSKFGPHPERSIVGYDLEQLTGWSSNLAANRMLVKLGGSESSGTSIAQQMLNQLGASSSTYTGDYRVGTIHRKRSSSRGAPDPPPIISSRVTTARDLATILRTLTRAAFSARDALRLTGLTVHEARVGLGWLLSSQPRGDNLGLLRPWIGSTPMAQKNGWLNEARHTAAVIFTPSGPKLVVLLTYRGSSLTRPEAAALGKRVLGAAGVIQ